MEEENKKTLYFEIENAKLNDPDYPHIKNFNDIEPVEYGIELSPEIKELIKKREILLKEYNQLKTNQKESEEQLLNLEKIDISEQDIQVLTEVYGKSSQEVRDANNKFIEYQRKANAIVNYDKALYIKEKALHHIEKLIEQSITKENEEYYAKISNELCNMIEEVLIAFKAPVRKYEKLIATYKGLLKFSGSAKLYKPIAKQGLISPTIFLEKLNSHLRDIRYWINK